MKRFFAILFGSVFFIFWMIGAVQSCSDVSDQGDYPTDDVEELDTIRSVHKHQRTWLDYNNSEQYSVVYSVESADESKSARERLAFEVESWETEEQFWAKVYLDLYEKSKSQLHFIQDSLQFIGDSLQLGREDFARMVVSFVQDIPYNYILPEGCEGHEDFPCVPNVKFGILSPIEFLNTLQGDCDTRTVLLFTLLRNFGYEPVILNSNEYLHSMLALDISTSGEYLEHRGKRYAFWETTNIGWLPGMIPPDMSTLSFSLRVTVIFSGSNKGSRA